MNKNDIIGKAIDRLISQREKLVEEITKINHNEPSHLDRSNCLDKQIIDIDMRIDGMIMNITVTE